MPMDYEKVLFLAHASCTGGLKNLLSNHNGEFNLLSVLGKKTYLLF